MSPLITKYFVILRTKYNFPSRKGKLKKRELFSICKYIHTYKICARPQVGCTTTYPRIRCNSRTHRIGFFQFSPLSRHSLAIIRRIKISCYKKKRKKNKKPTEYTLRGYWTSSIFATVVPASSKRLRKTLSAMLKRKI